MPDPQGAGRVLVVDDNIINRKQLARLLTDQGFSVTTAEDGRRAVELLGNEGGKGTSPFDVILLDILMPEMDGYQVLAHVKSQPRIRHIPVIMISALDEMESVVRCIEMGAADYLPKPFKPALLQARLRASLAEKRLRDLELEYLEQAGRVADAAQEVEAGRFNPATLDEVGAREDALGRLARVFQRMAREVHLREQRLHRQLEQLRLDMEEMRRARAEPAAVWVPRDRQEALARGNTLPGRTRGAALFADISGFTPLTAALTKEMGLRRGAEELTRAINQVYGALVAEVHRYGGSVIGFAGDAITCWLDRDDGRRALACGLAMQEAMALCKSVTTPAGATFPLSVKVAVVAGQTRRFLVGDPQTQVIEVVAGRALDRLAMAEHLAGRGEVVAGEEIADRLAGRVGIAEWRKVDGAETDERFALVTRLDETVPPAPWPALPSESLPDALCRPWLLPAIFERIQAGSREFLADLRPVAALFLNFRGIDYDGDEDAGRKLDGYIRWAQSVAAGFEGTLVQVTMGDKGSYFCIAFGAPVSHNDDELRAVQAARALLAPPPGLGFVTGIRIGIAAGLARAGPYGSDARRTYGVQGDRVNLAARLMQAAPEGGVLCDESIARPAGTFVRFEALPAINVKGRSEPVQIYRPQGDAEAGQRSGDSAWSPLRDRIDALHPSEQLVLKVSSALDGPFPIDLLVEMFPVDSEKTRLADHLASLEEQGLIRRQWPDEVYAIPDPAVQEAAYNGMLFVQRRSLHRKIAEWYEQKYASRLAPHYKTLARHWQAGEEPAKAVAYLEQAAESARGEADYAEAERLLQLSMKIEAETGVLSAAFYGSGAVHAGPDFDAAMRYALSRLEEELSPNLKYHSLWHTRDEVLPAVRRLAAMIGLNEEETRFVEVGAAYHDLGFLVGPEEHERAGADAAAQVLPGLGFSSEQVALVQGMILATRLPQSPHTLLEEILADADLDNLGRDDFWARSMALRAEIAAHGRCYTDGEWNARQHRFLLNHSYFTEAARSLREKGKRRNISTLEAMLAQAY